MAHPSPGALPMIKQILPFALSYAANAFVKMTLRSTDMRFTLIALVFEVLATIAVFTLVVELLKCYVTNFVVSNVTFGLWLMVPIYLFDFFSQGLSTSPSPLWFEGAAYILVFVLVILLTLAVFGQDLTVSLSATFEGDKDKDAGTS
jgi:hypothetical protein